MVGYSFGPSAKTTPINNTPKKRYTQVQRETPPREDKRALLEVWASPVSATDK